MLKASLVLFLCGVASSQSLPEPCKKLLPSNNNGFLASGDVLHKCYDAIPFNASTRADFVNVIKTSLQFHAALPYLKQKYPDVDPLKDMAAIINDPAVTSREDLGAKLREWSDKTYEKTLISVGDSCFGVMLLNQPFAIAFPSGSASGLPLIVDVVKGDPGASKDEAYLSAFWKSKSNLDTYKYKGYQVQSINGQDPYVLAKSIVDHNDVSVSAAFTSYYIYNGTWFPNYGALSQRYPSDREFFTKPVSYELKGPSGDSVTLTDIPWVVLPTFSFPVDDATWTRYSLRNLDSLAKRCFGITTDFAGLGSAEIKIGASTSRGSNLLVGRDVSTALIPEAKSPLVQVDDNTFVFTMCDAIFYLDDELLMNDEVEVSSDGMARFRNLDAQFADAKKRASRLIIDISSSSFGCEGQVLIKYLFGVEKPLEYNLLLTAEVNETITAAPNSENYWIEPYLTKNIAPIAGSNILLNTQSLNLPGSPTFSSRFTKNVCSKYEALLLPNMTKLQGGWNPDNVVILSNGFCADGCNEFVRILTKQLGIKTHVYGDNVSNLTINYDLGYRVSAPAKFFSDLGRTNSLFDSVKHADGWFKIWVPAYNAFDSAAPGNATPIYFENKEPDVRLNVHSGDYPLGVWKAAAAAMPAAPPPPNVPGSGKGSGASAVTQTSIVVANMLLVSAILVLLTGIASSQTLPEPCQKLLPSANNGLLASGDVLQSCYSAIPFNASTRAEFVNIAKASLQFHATLPFVRQKGLDPLKDITTIINDPALTSRLDIANKLREWDNTKFDALMASGDTCFGNMGFYQPFAIALPAGSASGLPVIVDVVKGNLNSKDEAYLSAFWKSKSNLDAYKYKGYQVKSINGQDPYINLGNEKLVAKSTVYDQEAGISSAFTSYSVFDGSWFPSYGLLSARTGPFGPEFFSKSVTYELQGPSGDSITIKDIPWAVLPSYFADNSDPDDASWMKNFQKQLDALGKRCFGVQTSSSSSASGDIKVAASGIRHPNRLVGRDISSPILPQDSKSPLIKVDANTFVFTLSDSIMYLDDYSMSSQVDVDEDTMAIFKDLDASFAEAKKSASRLIIDITDGSFGCEAQILTKYLFGAHKPLELNFWFSPEVLYTVSSLILTEGPFLSTNLAPTTGDSIYRHLNEMKTLPESPVFSNHFTRNVCSKYEALILPNMTTLQGGWNPANVILVGDGGCSTGCNDFFRTLTQQVGIKNYVYGYNVKNVTSTFGTGLITPSKIFPKLDNYLFDSVRSADGTFRFFVPPFNYFDPAAPADATPLFFESMQFDVRLNVHSGDYPLGVWKAAAAIMPTAAPPSSPGSSKPSSAPISTQISALALMMSLIATLAAL
ncbi:hypothetical protein HDU97_001699 [Phlyctochytrium planicorne]|nr:hypothetical protein HDU97_001699 [Phlyctochytrium planicorne]